MNADIVAPCLVCGKQIDECEPRFETPPVLATSVGHYRQDDRTVSYRFKPCGHRFVGRMVTRYVAHVSWEPA